MINFPEGKILHFSRNYYRESALRKFTWGFIFANGLYWNILSELVFATQLYIGTRPSWIIIICARKRADVHVTNKNMMRP